MRKITELYFDHFVYLYIKVCIIFLIRNFELKNAEYTFVKVLLA